MSDTNPIVKKLSLMKKKVPISKFMFPEMPKMYLELLENKDKIKQELVNTEYVPPSSNSQFQTQSQQQQFDIQPISTKLDKLINEIPEYREIAKELNNSEASDDDDSVSDVSEYSKSSYSQNHSIASSSDYDKQKSILDFDYNKKESDDYREKRDFDYNKKESDDYREKRDLDYRERETDDYREKRDLDYHKKDSDEVDYSDKRDFGKKETDDYREKRDLDYHKKDSDEVDYRDKRDFGEKESDNYDKDYLDYRKKETDNYDKDHLEYNKKETDNYNKDYLDYRKKDSDEIKYREKRDLDFGKKESDDYDKDYLDYHKKDSDERYLDFGKKKSDDYDKDYTDYHKKDNDERDYREKERDDYDDYREKKDVDYRDDKLDDNYRKKLNFDFNRQKLNFDKKESKEVRDSDDDEDYRKTFKLFKKPEENAYLSDSETKKSKYSIQAPKQIYKYAEAPSLSQLNMKESVIPNLNYMSNDSEEEDLKRELLFKFEILKKSYKDVDIPQFSIHSDYKTIKRTYETTVKKLSIDNCVSSYKTYLIGGFMGVEYILGNWLGFDMQGFTQQQILSMSSYERLLIELGEKSYVDEESQWPVEMRLIGMIIMNAAFFIVSKMITKRTGTNILNMINSMNTSTPTSAPKKKRPMRGPNINLDNLPDA